MDGDVGDVAGAGGGRPLASLVGRLLEDGSLEALVVPALLVALIGLALLSLILLALLLRRSAEPQRQLGPRLEQLERAEERTERAVREELAKSREEAVGSARHLREELTRQLQGIGQASEQRANDLRGVVDKRLLQIHEESGRKLDAMRATVDEKLQGTLEKRLGEAFEQVSQRLEAVHQGLGEMQSLASGVGDLKRVLTNVKTRGTWAEVQLGELLASVLAADQYAENVATRPGSGERVEFALRLPGRSEGDEDVWLPIDAKFPHEDYQRLVEAEERVDPEGVAAARKSLEARIQTEARKIRDKYLQPPRTTDFGILFLPTEGLHAEVLRRPGLVERLQRDCRVVIAGPTTLAALLNSLQMGFRTLAIQKRSSEVWKLLGAVKTQFGQFSGLLEKVQEKLDQASNTIGDASKKSRSIESRLRRVEELPEGQASRLLPELSGDDPPR